MHMTEVEPSSSQETNTHTKLYLLEEMIQAHLHSGTTFYANEGKATGVGAYALLREVVRLDSLFE